MNCVSFNLHQCKSAPGCSGRECLNERKFCLHHSGIPSRKKHWKERGNDQQAPAHRRWWALLKAIELQCMMIGSVLLFPIYTNPSNILIIRRDHRTCSKIWQKNSNRDNKIRLNILMKQKLRSHSHAQPTTSFQLSSLEIGWCWRG